MIDLDKQKAMLLIVVFIAGFIIGFELCLFTFVRRAIVIAQEAIASSLECLTLLKESRDVIKRLLIQEKAKSTKRIVH